MKIEDLFVRPEGSLRDIMWCIDRSAKGVALVVDDRRLLDVITDGDVRRAILAGAGPDSPVEHVVAQKRRIAGQEGLTRPDPFTAPAGTPRADLLRYMHQYGLRHIPLLDGAGRVVDVVFLADFVRPRELSMKAVVMAGGLGVRLRPLTDALPKPMLPVRGQPLLERIVNQLREAGIRRVSLATHYKKEAIARHFGRGDDFGVSITYLEETEPRGTAGALALLGPWTEPLLVINGDILTRVDFGAMLEFHRERTAAMTVGVSRYNLEVPYGVVDTDGDRVVRVTEKPVVGYFVSAGIYLLGPEVHRYVPREGRCEMPDLINRLAADAQSIVSFPIFEYWLDIGRIEDYEQSQRDAGQWPT